MESDVCDDAVLCVCVEYVVVLFVMRSRCEAGFFVFSVICANVGS